MSRSDSFVTSFRSKPVNTTVRDYTLLENQSTVRLRLDYSLQLRRRKLVICKVYILLDWIMFGEMVFIQQRISFLDTRVCISKCISRSASLQCKINVLNNNEIFFLLPLSQTYSFFTRDQIYFQTTFWMFLT